MALVRHPQQTDRMVIRQPLPRSYPEVVKYLSKDMRKAGFGTCEIINEANGNEATHKKSQACN